MRYIRYAFLGGLAVVLISVAMANRGPVTLRLLPDELAAPLGLSWSTELPLFLIILASVIAGLLIGFVWEWLREAKHRSAATQHKREAGRLAREVDRLKTQKNEPEDEVLALIDGKGTR